MTGSVDGWTSWRFAARLARREVRRRPGRTALVVLLIALPVAAMTAGSVLARTASSEDSWWPVGTDLVVEQQGGALPDIPVPEGASALSYATVHWAPIQSTSGMRLSGVNLIGGDGGVLEAHPAETVGNDTVPADGEVWLSVALADDLGLATGDLFSLDYPNGSWTVIGVGDYEKRRGERVITFGTLPTEQFTPAHVSRRALVDLPPGTSPDDRTAAAMSIQAALMAPPPVESTPESSVLGEPEIRPSGWVEEVSSPGIDGQTLGWGWVAGAIATGAMGIVIAAAFATSARRQITTLGVLAANGAPEDVRARTMSLQGFWTGLVGSALGIGGTLVGLIVGRSPIARLIPEVDASYVIAPADLMVIAATGIGVATAAAAIPARSASRIPVLTALAGRRPLGVVPRRLVPLGVAVFAGGVFLLVVAASSTDGGNATTAAAVLGGLAVLAGAGCASPLAIDRMSNASAAAGGSWRFAGRSLARTRSRSAAVVTAIAVTGAVASAGSAAALRIEDDGYRTQYLPRDAVVLQAFESRDPAAGTNADGEHLFDWGPLPARPVDESLQEGIDAVLPGAEWHDLRTVTWDDPPTSDDERNRVDVPTAFPDTLTAIGDPAVLDLVDLGAADRARLHTTGALLMEQWIIGGRGPASRTDTVQIRLARTEGDVQLTAAVREHFDLLSTPEAPPGLVTGPFAMLMTEQKALELGLDIVHRGAIVRAGHDLSGSERDRIHDLVWDEVSLADHYVAAAATAPDAVQWNASIDGSSWSPPAWMVQAAIITAALIMVLLVVSIALALAATEARDERDVLVAVGARPNTIRSMAGAKAVVLSLTGVVLAVPTGLLPLAAVLRTRGETILIPWLSVAALLLAVPAIGGIAAWTVSALAQRVRPVRMSTLTVE